MSDLKEERTKMNEGANREEELFEAARRLGEDGARAAFLADVCAGDEGLRQRVEGLLASQAEAEELFQPLSPAPSSASSFATPELVGTIGRYTLQEKIGEGGMGVVYRALQQEPVRRQVALKIIKLGMDTRQVVARFEAERQALAMMDHPNIAKILDAGVTGEAGSQISDQRSRITAGRPYFVMELVEGTPITDFCASNSLSLDQRLRLFICVSQAVQHAHQKGIVHRDLKPSNVLVTVSDGAPAPKVIDFGVAKALHQRLTEKTLFTQHTTLIGTPAYMSPEQAEMSRLDVDTRSDIYSLGVLLYELLTSGTPFPEEQLRSMSYSQMQRILLEEEPERPSIRLRKASPSSLAARPSRLASDLDWIVMKCLEKDRNRRYETANELAADLNRFLDHEPVAARPPTARYRLHKALRRHRTASLAAGLIALAVVVGTVLSGWALWRERAARRAADDRLDAALTFVGEVLTNVAPRLQNLTGAAAVQENLGQATLDFGRRLRTGVEGDSTVRVTLARALIALSAAQNPGGANTVGGFESGLELAQEAIRLLAGPIPSLPESERLNLQLSARFAFVQCLYGLGRWEEGIAGSEELEVLYDQIEQVSGSSPLTRSGRWNVRANIGYALLLAGRPARAVEQNLSLLGSDWALGIGDNASSGRETLANARCNLAAAFGLMNQFEPMLTNAAIGHHWWTNLVAQHPQNARYHAGRIEGWSTLGWAYVGAGRTSEGLALLEQARRESDVLVDRDPANDQFQLTRAVAAGMRALAFAAWSADAAASPEERRDRLSRADASLLEAEQFTRLAKSKEAEARLELARAGVEAIRLETHGSGPGGSPP